jgi:xylulose-5-phosphate/fructose-6-phosphate phosphoketolase
VLSQAYLEGTYSEVYPDKSEDIAGMQRFFKQFSFPGGIGSHARDLASLHRSQILRDF